MWNKVASTTGLVATLLAAQVVWGEGPAEKRGSDGWHHVVMHVNSGDEKVQKGALNNIKHLYQELGRGSREGRSRGARSRA